MSTAIVGKVGMKTIEKSLEETKNLAKPLDTEKKFSDIMGEIGSGMDFANSLGIEKNGEAPIDTLNTIDGNQVDFSGVEDINFDSTGDTSRHLVDMLGEVNKGQMQMDNLVNHVLYSGKRFSNQELLVIQAHVFSYAQMTEMTVKVAEQGVNSVKTVLNTQVQ